jgi:NAD(P)-dependent dehydrogenase (short-subunit alcohol dehydrogenase family)
VQHLSGRTAVITGGGSGIGLATARLLAAEGMHIVIVDVEHEPALLAAAELGGMAVTCDVGNREAMDDLADRVFARFGAVHVLFNNAGVAVAGPTVEMRHEDWEWLMRVNLWGPIHGVEAFLPRMVAQRLGGHVLFTASFAGLVPNVGLGVYCVTKYGVVAMAEVLRRELAPEGIGVSVLCPMRVETNIGTSERNRPAQLGGPDASPRVADQGEDNPDLAGRVLPVEHVAAEVVAAIKENRLYILPHSESLPYIRNRFARIERDISPD